MTMETFLNTLILNRYFKINQNGRIILRIK